MKTKFFFNSNIFERTLSAIVITAFIVLISGCDDDDPKREDTPELITRVVLTFSPSIAGTPIVVNATDPDGEGVQSITVDGPINLSTNESYTLTIQLVNHLAQPSEPGYNITAEVEEESDEHMLFFSWTNNVFNDPLGDGNIDSRNDDVNYEDSDPSGLPLGLETFWTTGGFASGKFRVVLKHQPGLKSATSPVTAGETDLDVEFTINVQ